MIQRLLPFLSLIILFVALSIASPHFLTQTNLSSVVRQTAVINIMALGMTMIIIAGGIDLSVGAILAMGGAAGMQVPAVTAARSAAMAASAPNSGHTTTPS